MILVSIMFLALLVAVIRCQSKRSGFCPQPVLVFQASSEQPPGAKPVAVKELVLHRTQQLGGPIVACVVLPAAQWKCMNRQRPVQVAEDNVCQYPITDDAESTRFKVFVVVVAVVSSSGRRKVLQHFIHAARFLH